MSFIPAHLPRHAAAHRPPPATGAAPRAASVPTGVPPADSPRASVPSSSDVRVDARVMALWRARLDALTRWCLADLPLTPGAAACAPGTRDTLGDLLRRALTRAGDGVVDLLDALDELDTPAARARVARVLGTDTLLVVVTTRGGGLLRADVRACRSPDEARSLVLAFLGASPEVAAHGYWTDGRDSGALVMDPSAPVTITPLVQHSGGHEGDCTLVLPFLSLDGRTVPAPDVSADRFGELAAPTLFPLPDAALPTVLGGVLRPGAAFLGAPTPDAAVEEDAATWEWGDAPDPVDADDPADSREQSNAQDGDDAPDADDADDDVDDQADDDRAGVVDAVVVTLPDAAASQLLLDRVRARAAADRVSAVLATDDGVAEHVCDVVAWLAEASEQELRALIRQGWSGDAGIELAEALAEDDPEVADVLRHARRHEVEVTVEIDDRQAAAWLARHRPELAERLDLA